MILVDLSQTIIAVAFQHLKGEYRKDLVRSMVFTTLLSYKKKFGAKYGNMVLAYDNRDAKSWRKLKFEHYKASRKDKFKDPKEAEKWAKIFETANSIVEECKEFLTWRMVGIPGAEADDVIAILSKTFGNTSPVLVISTDGDFPQLQKYRNVSQWNPVTKKFMNVENPIEYLELKILTGDKGDGIPNILSPSDSYVTKTRCKSITEGIIEEWLKFPKPLQNKYSARIAENRELIDFDKIPIYIKDGILDAYENCKTNSLSNLLKFFMANRMVRIMTDIDEFKIRGEYESTVHSNEDFFG